MASKAVISMEMRTRISQKISTQAFAKEKLDLEEKAIIAGEMVYRHFVTEEQETAMRALPRHFFDWRESIRLDVVITAHESNGRTYPSTTWFPAHLRRGLLTVPMPASIARNSYITAKGLPDDLRDECNKIGQAFYDLHRATVKLQEETTQILLHLKTLKKLKDQAPTLYELIPPELLRPEPLLPTTLIGDVLTKLSAAGIPPQEEEEAA